MIIIARVKKAPDALLGLSWSLTLFLFVYLITHTENAAAAVTSSLRVCALRLIPSLFPFMVLTNLICSTGLADLAARALGNVFSKATGLPPDGAAVFLLGSVGGFPIGAVAAKKLLDRGRLSATDAGRLIAFSNNAGLAFCVGGIGPLFVSAAVGLKLWGVQLGAAVLFALVTAERHVSISAPRGPERHRVSPGRLLTLLSESVSGSAVSMLKVCAFAVFFGTVGDVICRILPPLPAALAAQFLELTLTAGLSSAFGRAGLPICAFALGFAGLSVHAQVAAILEGSGVPMRRFCLFKLAQGAVSALVFAILCQG